MENLKRVGVVYNEFCDRIEEHKDAIKKYSQTHPARLKELISNEKREIRRLKTEQKEYRKALSKDELDAYKDYRRIHLDIKRCEVLKNADKVEAKIFSKLNPAYIYMIPAAVGAAFFTILPCFSMIVGSLFKVDLVSLNRSKFRGLWNFEMIFTRDTEFVQAIWNTILFAFLTVIMLMFVTVIMAVWLSRNTKVHNFAQTLIFTPHISSMVAVSILWVLMLDPQGIVNQMLSIFGIKGPNWLMDTRTSLLSVAMVTVWKSIGYYVLIIISGLQSIPPYVYEAAKLDKASKLRVFTKITIPLLSPTLMFVFVMKFVNSFKAFAAIDLMTQGGPQGSSMVLGYWIYNAGRVKFNYGFAMAGGIVLTVLVAGFTLTANKIFNKDKRL